MPQAISVLILLTAEIIPFSPAEEVEALCKAAPTASTAPAAQTPTIQTTGTVERLFILPDLPPVYK